MAVERKEAFDMSWKQQQRGASQMSQRPVRHTLLRESHQGQGTDQAVRGLQERGETGGAKPASDRLLPKPALPRSPETLPIAFRN